MNLQRKETIRVAQMSALADAAGATYQSFVHLANMLKDSGEPYAMQFGRGARGASLTIEHMLSLVIAWAVENPTIAAERVPALATAKLNVPCLLRVPVPIYLQDVERRTLNLKSVSWKAPHTLFEDLAWIVQTLVSDDGRFLKKLQELDFEVIITHAPITLAQIRAGATLVEYTTSLPEGSNPANVWRQSVIPAAYFATMARLWRGSPLYKRERVADAETALAS